VRRDGIVFQQPAQVVRQCQVRRRNARHIHQDEIHLRVTAQSRLYLPGRQRTRKGHSDDLGVPPELLHRGLSIGIKRNEGD
jgi:hypothetical protein